MCSIFLLFVIYCLVFHLLSHCSKYLLQYFALKIAIFTKPIVCTNSKKNMISKSIDNLSESSIVNIYNKKV